MIKETVTACICAPENAQTGKRRLLKNRSGYEH